MGASAEAKYRFQDVDAGAACLSFCDTVDERPLYESGNFTPTGDHLLEPQDALEWVKHVKLFESAKHRAPPAPSAREAQLLLVELRDLRALLFELFLDLALLKPPAPLLLGRLNSFLKKMPPQELSQDEGKFRLRYSYDTFREAVIGLLLEDVLTVITSEQANRIRVCAAEGCGWLFLDKSKNGSRRWCQMGDCGNREKARRFYQRSKKKER